MNEFKITYDKTTPIWTLLEVSFTKSEITKLTRMIMNRDIKRYLSNLKTRTKWNLENIIIDSFKEIPGIKRTFRSTYMNAITGAMNRLMKSFKGILNNWFASIYEQGFTRFLGVINA